MTCDHSNYDDYFEKCTDCDMTQQDIMKQSHPDTETIWRDGKQYFFQWTTDDTGVTRLDYIALTQTCDETHLDADECDQDHETFDFQEIHQ